MSFSKRAEKKVKNKINVISGDVINFHLKNAIGEDVASVSTECTKTSSIDRIAIFEFENELGMKNGFLGACGESNKK